MDYDQFYIQNDQMPYYQRQEVTRPCGCPHMAGCHDGPLVDTNIEAVSQASMAPSEISDGQASKFDDQGMFVESYQSSASSAYNTEDARTDGMSATDLSAFFSSSEDEGSPHRHQVSKYAAILHPQYGNNKLRDQYATFHNLGSEPLQNNSGTSPPLFAPVQQNPDLFVDPSRIQNRSAGIEDIQQDRIHTGNPKKRRCLLEQSRTIVPQKRAAITAKIDEDTRAPLLSSPTLLQTRLVQLPADLNMPQSVDLGLLPPLESRNFHKLEAKAKLGDNFVQDSPKKSAARTRDEWVPKSPVPCLQPFHGNTVEPKPRDPKKPFACVSGCGQTFARKGEWQRHLTLNWLESYWQCPSCDKHFAPDRSDKLYGKGQHLEKTHRRPGEKTNRRRDYHHNISDEKFRKRCGFCGVMCNSFSEFTRHVGAHFRDASANPPFDMRIWRKWEELATASSGDGGDDDSDDNDDDDEKGDGDQNTEDNDYQNQDDSSGGGEGPTSGRDTDKPGGPDYGYGHGPQQDQAPPDYFGDYPPAGFDFMDRTDASSWSGMVDDACQDHTESQIVRDDLSERLSNMYLGDDISRERRRSLSQPHLSRRAAVTSRVASTKYELWRFKRNGNDWTDTTRDKIPSPQEELASKTATGGSKDGVVHKQIQAMVHTRRCQIVDLLKEKYEQTYCRWEVAWIKEVRTEKSLTGRYEVRVMDVIVARTSQPSRLSLLTKIHKSASSNTVSSSRDEGAVQKNRTYSSKDDYNNEKNDKRVKYKDSGSGKRGGGGSSKEVLDPDPFGNCKLFASSGKPLDTGLGAPAVFNEVAYEAEAAVVKRLAQHPHDLTQKRRAISSGPDAGHDTFLKVADRDLQFLIELVYSARERFSSIGRIQQLHNLSEGLRDILSEYRHMEGHHQDLKPSNILVVQVGTFKIADLGLSTFRSGIEKGGRRQPASVDTSQGLQGLERKANHNKANRGKSRIHGQARIDIRDDAETALLVMLEKGEPTTGVHGEPNTYGTPQWHCGIEPRVSSIPSIDIWLLGCVLSEVAALISPFHEQMTKDQMLKSDCDLVGDLVRAFENLGHSTGYDLPRLQMSHFLKGADPNAAGLAISATKTGLEHLKSQQKALHWKTLYAKKRVWDALYYVGRREESSALRSSLLDEQSQAHGKQAHNVLWTLTNFADDNLQRGDLGDAEARFKDTLERAKRLERFERYVASSIVFTILGKTAVVRENATTSRGSSRDAGTIPQGAEKTFKTTLFTDRGQQMLRLQIPFNSPILASVGRYFGSTGCIQRDATEMP
jgi:serine/threonine protein kinase